MTIKQRFRVPVLALAIAGALGLTGYTVGTGNRITWSYFTASSNLAANPTGSTTLIPYNTSTGLPNYADFTAAYPSALSAPNLPSDFITRIGLTLPEGVNVTTSGKVPGGLAGDPQTNLKMLDNGDVWVTFLNETAGYANSVGFFVYDSATPPTSRAQITSDQIILPNVSIPSPLTKAGTQGHTIYLGKIPKGKSVGFFVASNGWTTNGRTSSSGGKIAGVNEKISTDWIFYSLRGLNVETSTNYLNQHTIVLDDQTVTGGDNKQYERLVLGFEDYLRSSGSDHDFNDVVMAVHVYPASAVDITHFPKLLPATDPDTDGDGVKDSVDEFPKDPTAASSRWPLGDSTTWGTLAYEDTWPLKGDYDLNDMVIRYRTKEILNAVGKVSKVEIDYSLDARGGIYTSGFALALPGIAASNIKSSTLAVNVPAATTTATGAVTSVATDISPLFAGSANAVFELFKDAYKYAPKSTCSNYYNTESGCAVAPSTTFKLVVTLNTPTSTFPASPYDPFIFRTASVNENLGSVATDKVAGIEVHLPGQSPTQRAVNLFNSHDDKSVCSSVGTSAVTCTNSYKDAKSLPWALNLPKVWVYPLEFKDVVSAYSTIVNWAQTSGQSNTSWYVTPTDAAKTYTGK